MHPIADKLFSLLCVMGFLWLLASVCLGGWSMFMTSLPWWVGLLAATSPFLPLLGLVFSGNTNAGELGVGALLLSSMPLLCLQLCAQVVGMPLSVVAPEVDSVSMWLLASAGITFGLFVGAMILVSVHDTWERDRDNT